MDQITFNLQAERDLITYGDMEGRQHMIIPCVMLVEGVHDGSQGGLLYTPEELAKTPVVWNGRPVVVQHPTKNGVPISAGNPETFTEQKVGQLFNTRWEDGKLKSDVWLDEDKANEVDERILTALQDGIVMEVSTGLFTDNEPTSGVYNGKSYVAIARNFRPDHLALLPDKIGACSVDDGAGLLRNQLETGVSIPPSIVQVWNELSHSDISHELHALIKPNTTAADKFIGGPWVVEIFDDFFIYEVDDSTKLYYQKYTNKDDKIALMGMPTECERVTRYKLKDGTMVGNQKFLADIHKGEIVNKEQKVKALIANEKTPWVDGDSEALMNFSEARLDELLANEVKSEDESTQDVPAVAASTENKVAEDAPVKNDASDESVGNKQMTLNEFLATVPTEYRDVVQCGLAEHDAKKTKLITVITSNERNTFTLEYLQSRSMAELIPLAKLAEIVPTATIQPTYAGQAAVANIAVTANSEEEPLTIPELDFSKGN